MFAKVFGQIFDSSVAEDYTVRHMFIDLLILADATGAVDMTHDAISRRTNVPIEIVRRCIASLLSTDVNSRSTVCEGRRIIPLDSHRDWGWQIVNYTHYRKIRDEEVRRSYFRDYQRKRRAKNKNVKDKSLTKGDSIENASSTSSFVQRLKENVAYKGLDIDREIGKMQAWLETPKGKGRKLTHKFMVNWLNRQDIPVQIASRKENMSWKKAQPLPAAAPPSPEFEKQLADWIARGRPLGEDPWEEKA